MPSSHVSILVPVYRNAGTLRALHQQVQDAVTKAGATARFIFVEDAGDDQSREILEDLAGNDTTMVLIFNPENLGQQEAIRRGLSRAAGQDIIVMDADLQDPPAAIPLMLERLWATGADAVFATRTGAYQSLFRMAASTLYRALLARLVPLPRGAGGFVALRGALAARLVASDNPRFHLAGMIGCHATRIEALAMRRNHRETGKSAYTERMRVATAFSNFACILKERFRHDTP